MRYPSHLYRRDDGERFTRQTNGKYTMDKTMMIHDPYEYPYELLMRNGFKTRLKDCVIEPVVNCNDGHGNEYD